MKNILIVSYMAILFSSCGSHTAQEEKVTDSLAATVVTLTNAQYRNAAIDTGMAVKQDVRSILKVTGTIDVPPQNMVSVSFPMGGYLKSTSLLPGMHIRKGEVIARMEDQQYIQLQQDYLTAKARQAYLESEYQRQKELNASKASSDKSFQQAEAEYRSNKILISGLMQKLQLIGIDPLKLNEGNISRMVSIHAPIDGYVSAVRVNVGKYVTPSDVLFELVNPTDIHLALTVFEKDINKLSIGQKLIAYSNGDPGKKYPCEIILIGKDVSPERAIQVHCHFEQYDKSLVPGMFMNADIEVNSAEAFAVPEAAIVRYGDKQYVFAARANNTYEMKEVVTGPAENGMVAIIDAKGLDLATQTLVTGNAYTLLMKLKNTAE
jgi:cobalt-zinc-cadmium efflux system membrane fusion protein